MLYSLLDPKNCEIPSNLKLSKLQRKVLKSACSIRVVLPPEKQRKTSRIITAMLVGDQDQYRVCHIKQELLQSEARKDMSKVLLRI